MDIVGVHFGKRYKRNKRINRYAIVFHVETKYENPTISIPKKIKIKTERGSLQVPTDIIETGRTRLASIMCGDKAYAVGSPGDTGAVGLFFKKNGLWYVCSNMHVLAPERLSQGSVTIPIPMQQPDVVCLSSAGSEHACLEKATFDGTDLAIARIQNQTAVNNVIRGIGMPNGSINSANLNYGTQISGFGAFSNQVLYGAVENNRVSRIVEYQAIQTQIDDMIQTTMPALLGDSGSPVVTNATKVVGIIAAIDGASNAYLIPSQDILSFVQPD